MQSEVVEMRQPKTKLRKCPLCNGEAKVDIAWDEPKINGRYGYICSCERCGSHTYAFRSIDEAGAAWTTEPVLEKNIHQISIFEIFC